MAFSIYSQKCKLVKSDFGGFCPQFYISKTLLFRRFGAFLFFLSSQLCYSGQFLAERCLRPGSPALLIVVYLLLMFVCHAAEPLIKSILRGREVFMTKLQSFTKSVFASIVKTVSESVGAVGAEVAAA